MVTGASLERTGWNCAGTELGNVAVGWPIVVVGWEGTYPGARVLTVLVEYWYCILASWGKFNCFYTWAWFAWRISCLCINCPGPTAIGGLIWGVWVGTGTGIVLAGRWTTVCVATGGGGGLTWTVGTVPPVTTLSTGLETILFWPTWDPEFITLCSLTSVVIFCPWLCTTC